MRNVRSDRCLAGSNLCPGRSKTLLSLHLYLSDPNLSSVVVQSLPNRHKEGSGGDQAGSKMVLWKALTPYVKLAVL